MLVKGDARVRIRTHEIRRLACSDHLKEIVYRCIGERRKRYESADELIEALRNPPAALKAGVLRSLKGVHLAFTGILSKRRSEAARAARRAGAIVHGEPLGAHHRRRARPAEPAAGRRPRCGPEAHGDQAAAREGPPHHAARRDAVLAAGRPSAMSAPGTITTSTEASVSQPATWSAGLGQQRLTSISTP